MPPKKQDAVILKGQDAEDVVLNYMLSMNRPFGYTDVFNNLHGSVQKASVSKILVSLAEKGALTQKLYGKVAIFVANQGNMPTLPQAECDALEKAGKDAEELKKAISTEFKVACAELTRIKTKQTDEELAQQTAETEAKAAQLRAHLEPLRSGAPLLTKAQLAELDTEWTCWHAEWLRRRKIFREHVLFSYFCQITFEQSFRFWDMVTGNCSPQDARTLEEDLGIELDSPEHIALGKSPLGNPLRRATLDRGK
ncbi:TBPIP-domain-containing protein [Vararia minispora EC-137]|uniref:TBPIP-domain-containing protein n=1 Tax=Vararia minispora EC-137 TaxID=1314806 RepID=A0ACB8QU09_9AGAM|nr:TBPIP-domain-containing protein [Vararia minispora EC-137]